MPRKLPDAGPVAPWLGVLQVEIGTPWARSLKEKRALLLPLLTRWRARPELSVARLSDHDAHGVETWALAAIDVDADRLRALLARARDEIAAAGLIARAARLDLEPWEPLDPRDSIAGVPGSTEPGSATR
ncbi:MAG: DUF503 domain-containing protein [Trueperaceae bacterium]